MILTHDGKRPRIDESAYVAPNATVCGDVRIAPGCRVLFGACIVAEGQPVTLGNTCIVMENAVIRSTDEHPTSIGAHCLIGPHTHVAGCTLEDCVFVATGATVFHGAHLGYNVEVRVNAIVHLRTTLAAHTIVPIGWVAVGDPPVMLPPAEHDAIWGAQEPLDFPRYVYGIARARAGHSNMPDITARRSLSLGRHADDRIDSNEPQVSTRADANDATGSGTRHVRGNYAAPHRNR
jgi:carbonic anhydrase/acetyltransferase-like protein (isoleucine patch superfamily)